MFILSYSRWKFTTLQLATDSRFFFYFTWPNNFKMREQLSFLFPKGTKSDSVLAYISPALLFTVKLSKKATDSKDSFLHHISCLVAKLNHAAALASDYPYIHYILLSFHFSHLTLLLRNTEFEIFLLVRCLYIRFWISRINW